MKSFLYQAFFRNKDVMINERLLFFDTIMINNDYRWHVILLFRPWGYFVIGKYPEILKALKRNPALRCSISGRNFQRNI